MNRYAVTLLATTSLSGLALPATAAVVFENISGFGNSATDPTIVPLGDTLYVGNSDLTTPSWFEIPGRTHVQTVQLQFTVARLGQSEGTAVPVDMLGEGGSSLPAFLGTPVVEQLFLGPLVAGEVGRYEGSSFPLALQPVLNLLATHVGAEGGSEGSSMPVVFAEVTPPPFTNFQGEGGSTANSFIVDLALAPGESLPLSFQYDFDYTLEVRDAVPEPATGALVGLGLVGLAAVRRRRRKSDL